MQSYLYPKVLVTSAQNSVNVFQHKLSRRFQEVKVQEEAEQRWSVNTL